MAGVPMVVVVSRHAVLRVIAARARGLATRVECDQVQ